MKNVKPVTTLLAAHFRLSSTQCTQLDEEVDYMSEYHILMLWVI